MGWLDSVLAHTHDRLTNRNYSATTCKRYSPCGGIPRFGELPEVFLASGRKRQVLHTRQSL